MTERRTAYERTEVRQGGGPLLCVPRVIRYSADHFRSWLHVWDGGRNERTIIHGYCRRPGGMMLAVPAEEPCGDFVLHLQHGSEVPWERLPQAIRDHVLHVIEELES